MRLVTRGDLDGLTCAVLITSCETIEEIVMILDGKVPPPRPDPITE